MIRKSKQWIKDRNRLREEIREGNHAGVVQTMLCCLVSRMRGKMHMRSYKLYEGGWKAGASPLPSIDVTERMRQHYGTEAERYMAAGEVVDLDDQKKWIEKFRHVLGVDSGLQPIVDRVLADEYRDVAPLAALETKEDVSGIPHGA